MKYYALALSASLVLLAGGCKSQRISPPEGKPASAKRQEAKPQPSSCENGARIGKAYSGTTFEGEHVGQLPYSAALGGTFNHQLGQMTGGWGASSGELSSLVEVGAADKTGTTGGIVLIHAAACSPGRESNKLIEVPGAGALSVTSAPTGLNTAKDGGARGFIKLAGSNGFKGTLNVANGAVVGKDGRAVETLAGGTCEAIKFGRERPGALAAGAIEAWGLDCEEAGAFIDSIHDTCSTPPCTSNGFDCPDLYGEGGGSVPMWCQHGAERVEFTWAGGY